MLASLRALSSSQRVSDSLGSFALVRASLRLSSSSASASPPPPQPHRYSPYRPPSALRSSPPTVSSTLLQPPSLMARVSERVSSRLRSLRRAYGSAVSRRVLGLLGLVAAGVVAYVLVQYVREAKVFDSPLLWLMRSLGWTTDLEGMAQRSRAPPGLDRGYSELVRGLRFLIAHGDFAAHMARFPVVRERLGRAPLIDSEQVQVRARYSVDAQGAKRIEGASARFVLFTPETGGAECLLTFEVRQREGARGSWDAVFRVKEASIDLSEPTGPLRLRIEDAFAPQLTWSARELSERAEAHERDLKAKDEALSKQMYQKAA